MARHKDGNWTLPDGTLSYEGAQLAVLMDIRDELQTLNRVFGCHNAQAIPDILRRIESNTKRRKRRTPRKQS